LAEFSGITWGVFVVDFGWIWRFVGWGGSVKVRNWHVLMIKLGLFWELQEDYAIFVVYV
jgi:hypothetical protein